MKDKKNQKEYLALLYRVSQRCNVDPPDPKSVQELDLKILSMYPWEAVERAVYVHVSRSPWLPRPSDIIQILSGSCRQRGQEAWQAVVKAMRILSSMDSVDFQSPAIHWCIDRMGGWQQLCKTPVDELKWSERKFLELWERAEISATWENAPAYFLGSDEIQRKRLGWELPPVYSGISRQALDNGRGSKGNSSLSGARLMIQGLAREMKGDSD